MQNQYKRLSAGGIVQNISSDIVYNSNLFHTSLNEQQKIASCLSSLDELIEAHSQKLDTLKDHKKGLMQNLFPQEGETVPKYRFPEFVNDGDWVKKTIEQVAQVTTGNKDTQNKVNNGLYPFFVRSQTVERINSYSYDGEAILTSGDGVGVGKNFHYIDGKFDFHQRVYSIYNFSKEVCGKFVYMFFSQHFDERVMRMSAKNSVDSVRMAMITEMPISLPSKEEQKKIADCLSSLDALITGQTEKIEQLKLHKKGLMQGLFPKVKA
jgi:type I restriction enzyme S subunit